MFCLLVDFYNSMKYAKFQHRSLDKITKYIALYLEKSSFGWRQQFARVTQKPRVHVSKSHASCKNKLQSNKASRMVTQAYWNLARVYVDSRSCEKKCEVLYRATLNEDHDKVKNVQYNAKILVMKSWQAFDLF